MKSQIYDELVQLLNEKNILSQDEICPNEFRPITDVLRESWYIYKAIEKGYTKAIYIPTKVSFIAIVCNDNNEEKVMSGSNMFIRTFFEDYIYHICEDRDTDISDIVYNHFFCDGWIEPFLSDCECDEYFENSLLTMEYINFKDFYDEIVQFIDDLENN